MATGPNTITAEEITDTIKSLVDRIADAKLTQEVAKRGADVSAIANDAWRESEPMRRDAAKSIARAGDEAATWSRKSLQPFLKDLWNRRTIALGAAGAAVPVGRELADTAAVRLGLKQQQHEEARHWGAFFLGLILGAIGGAVVAMLTTPKRGSELREELGTRADEIASKARDEWVPMFERATSGNGHATEPIEDLADAAADAGDTAADSIEGGADAAAEAVSDAVDAVEREAP